MTSWKKPGWKGTAVVRNPIGDGDGMPKPQPRAPRSGPNPRERKTERILREARERRARLEAEAAAEAAQQAAPATQMVTLDQDVPGLGRAGDQVSLAQLMERARAPAREEDRAAAVAAAPPEAPAEDAAPPAEANEDAEPAEAPGASEPVVGPITVDLDPGNYAWCACGKSATQPFCDGSHEKAEGDAVPLLFKIKRAEQHALCVCKRTQTPPYCDGSHLQPEPADDPNGIETPQ